MDRRCWRKCPRTQRKPVCEQPSFISAPVAGPVFSVTLPRSAASFCTARATAELVRVGDGYDAPLVEPLARDSRTEIGLVLVVPRRGPRPGVRARHPARPAAIWAAVTLVGAAVVRERAAHVDQGRRCGPDRPHGTGVAGPTRPAAAKPPKRRASRRPVRCDCFVLNIATSSLLVFYLSSAALRSIGPPSTGMLTPVRKAALVRDQEQGPLPPRHSVAQAGRAEWSATGDRGRPRPCRRQARRASRSRSPPGRAHSP